MKKKKNNVLSAMRDIPKYTKGYNRSLLLFFILTLISSAIAMLPPYFYGKVIGQFSSGEFKGIYLFIYLTALAIVFNTALLNFVSYKTKMLAEFIRNNARLIAIRHLYKLDYEFYETNQLGSYLEKISSGSDSVRRMIKIFFTSTFNKLSQLILSIVIIFTVNIEIGLFGVFLLILFSVLVVTNSGKYQSLNKKVAEESEDVYAKVFDFTAKIKTVKFLNISEKLINILKSSYDGVIQKSRVLRKFERLTAASQSLLLDLSLVAVLAYLAYNAINGEIGLDVSVAIYAYFSKFTDSASSLWSQYEELNDTSVGVHRLRTIFEQKPTIDAPSANKKFPMKFKEMKVESITYKYKNSNKQALKNVSLSIKRGEKIALVGESGSGKTSLGKLLIKLYLPDSGYIKVDNIDLREIEVVSIFENIKVVPQDNELIETSIRENLQIVSESILSDEDIYSALEASDSLSFVRKLPQNIDTVIGSKGTQLSGGQKQRVCLARAIVSKPQILLLDEATANLDLISDKKILKSLNKMEELTVISITHRLNNAEEFDRIIVLNEGEIEAAGNHIELMRKSKTYKELWEAGVKGTLNNEV